MKSSLLLGLLVAGSALLTGCLGSPQHNRNHVEQIKRDLNALHDDFDDFWRLKTYNPPEWPIDGK